MGSSEESMCQLSALSLLILLSVQGIVAQVRQQQTVSVQLAGNNSRLDAAEGKMDLVICVLNLHFIYLFQPFSV